MPEEEDAQLAAFILLKKEQNKHSGEIEALSSDVADLDEDLDNLTKDVDKNTASIVTLAEDIDIHKKECSDDMSHLETLVDEKLAKASIEPLSVVEGVKRQFEAFKHGIEARIGDLRTRIDGIKIPAPLNIDSLLQRIEAVRLSIPKIPSPHEIPPPFDPTALEFSIEKIVESLNLLQKEVEELKKRKSGVSRRGMFGLGVRELVQDIDISPQLNGVTKTFNIPAIYKIITVDLSSFPNALRKNIDYTYTGTTITFTDEIDAASSLAAGQTAILTVINA